VRLCHAAFPGGHFISDAANPDFIKSDVLGIVASNHLALADRLGPEHPDCIDLAKLNSDAVDFAKSGVPVHIPEQ
jgi:RNA-dependent RNA polymerase